VKPRVNPTQRFPRVRLLLDAFTTGGAERAKDGLRRIVQGGFEQGGYHAFQTQQLPTLLHTQRKRYLMRRILILLANVVLLVSVVAPAASAHDETSELDISIVKAPVAPDGTTAGRALDFVVVLKDPDPDVDGIGMMSGGTIRVELDSAFDLTGSQGSPPAGASVAILQGWPQSPRLPFPYTMDITGNTITLTLTDDWPVGVYGPGPKALHLLLKTAKNPATPGEYSVKVSIRPDPTSTQTLEATGRAKIIEKVRPSINVMSVFSGPPGPPPPFFNPLFQELELGEDGRQVGMYLWEKGGMAAVGVDIEMQGARRGWLVQDGKKIGKISIHAPHDAGNFTLVTTEGQSVEVPALLTGVPTGLLKTRFTPDPTVEGHYSVTFEMYGGNQQTLRYDVSD